MSILEKINVKVIEGYKSGDEKRRILFQTLKSELLSAAKNKKGNLTDQDEIAVLKKELKLRSEALAQFKSAGRDDLIEGSDLEINEIKALLPAEMSSDEIRQIVKSAIASIQEKNFGAIMKQAMADLKGRADGKVVSEIVKEELAE